MITIEMICSVYNYPEVTKEHVSSLWNEITSQEISRNYKVNVTDSDCFFPSYYGFGEIKYHQVIIVVTSTIKESTEEAFKTSMCSLVRKLSRKLQGNYVFATFFTR